MELLAPAGSPAACRAALANGADSVYLGGKNFSARHSAENFSDEELGRVLFYAHSLKKKVYLTVNTLLDKRELESALHYIGELYREGLDAVIIQDLGLAKALNQVLPGLALHASTQMTIHNSQGCRLLKGLGVRRVVLARELSANDINLIKQESGDMELEAFVHGALCYSYSGQCLFSSMVGGRSGNRGRCAQPCRLPYQLVDSHYKTISFPGQTGPYLLSLSDLCLIDQLPMLKACGVNSLKIEGRMKRPEYVAVVTRVYREALDCLDTAGTARSRDQGRNDLLKIFNRTLSNGYFIVDEKGLLSSQRPNNRGVHIGRIVNQDSQGMAQIKLSGPISENDGLEVWVKRGKTPAVVVKNLLRDGKPVETANAGQVVSLRLNGQASPGDRVFKTHDGQLIDQAKESYSAEEEQYLALSVEANLQKDQPLSLKLIDQDGYSVSVQTTSLARPAQKHALEHDVLHDKLSRLGHTPYFLEKLVMIHNEPLMVPFSDINEARRRGVEELISLRKAGYSRTEPNPRLLTADIQKALKNRGGSKARSRLSVKVNGLGEARAALAAGAGRVYLGLEGLGGRQKPSSQEIKEIVKLAQSQGREMIPALPRIQKPGELDEFDYLAGNGYTLLAGNLGSIQWCLDNDIPVLADFGLNVFNPLSRDLLHELGVKGCCLSPELDAGRLEALGGGDGLEILIHGEIQLMVSQCCIFKELLGADGKSCRAFCRQGPFFLEDEKRYRFPLATDAYCRLYVFNSRTLCLMEYLDRLVHIGPEWLRIEARLETAEEVYRVTSIYREALESIQNQKKPDLSAVRRQLTGGKGNQYTRGYYLRGVQ
ncbi:MAG: DUF3656 domain-containing protein [Syntrophomonas sp.]